MNKKHKTTIYDISKKLNISAASVSRALNGNSKVNQKTRELVIKTAKEMNYKQNRLAQALKQGRTYNVGVIVPYINRNFFSSVIRGIEEELTPHGYHIIICQSHEEAVNEAEKINSLLNTQIDGIFISVSRTTQKPDHIQKVLQEQTPLVFFDRKINVPGASSVILDDYKAGYIATDHLIKEGCRKIAHLSGDINLEIYKNRFEGYKKALKDNSMEFIPDYVIQVNSKIQSGMQAINDLWKLNEKPDGIFSAGDYAALGAMQELRAKKIKIPQEVCVVGFSNESFTKFMELGITSMDQTPLVMGKIAAQVFLEQVQEKTLNIEKKVILPPELFIRASSSRKIQNLSNVS